MQLLQGTAAEAKMHSKPVLHLYHGDILAFLLPFLFRNFVTKNELKLAKLYKLNFLFA